MYFATFLKKSKVEKDPNAFGAVVKWGLYTKVTFPKIIAAPTKNLNISLQISESPKPRFLSCTAVHQASLRPSAKPHFAA